MRHRRPFVTPLRFALIVGLALTAAGCESLDEWNPFQEKEKKLTGDRHPVFPEGVPGVDYSAKPSQPANANVPLDTLQAPPKPAGQGNSGQQ